MLFPSFKVVWLLIILIDFPIISLYYLNKPHLVKIHLPFYILTDTICDYLVENVYIFAHRMHFSG